MTDPFPRETFDPNADAPLSSTTTDKLNRLEAAVDNLDVQDTKGDLLGYDGAECIRIPLGPNGTLLEADDTQAGGLSWRPVALQSIDSDSSISITGTPQNPTIGVDTIGEEQVNGLLADLASKIPLSTPSAIVTSSHTAVPGETVLADITLAGFTVTLPGAPADRTRITVKIVGAAPGNVLTIARNASDTFEIAGGPTSRSLVLPGQATTLQYHAADAVWLVVSNDLPLAQLDARYVAQAANSQLVLVNSTIAFDPTAATTWFVDLQANVTGSTLAAPALATGSVPVTLVWVQDGTGGRTYSWPPTCRFAGGAPPTDTTPNRSTSVTFAYDGAHWVETARAVAVG